MLLEEYKKQENTMPEELKGYKCPDKENCFECEFHNTKCIVFSTAGKKKYEQWKKKQERMNNRDCKEVK